MSDVCPLCGRMIPTDAVDHHHLIPKTFKGKGTIGLHRICHRKIHSVFSERELLKYYHTIERIMEHDDIKIFVEWVKTKHPDFYLSSRDSNNRKQSRRR